MSIKAFKLGPGELTVGETGTPVDFSHQCTKVMVKWSKDTEDPVPVLSGEELAGDTNYTAVLSATLLQDLDAAVDGIVDWSWTHKGEQHPFTFVPLVGKAINGVVTVDPIDIGGDVKKRNTSDIEWACVGEPELVDDLVSP